MCSDFIEEHLTWNYKTLRQNHSKNFISQIEKFDDFYSVTDHVNCQCSIGKFLNQKKAIAYLDL